MDAPRVIAKGAEALADEMRRISARYGVPIVQRPRLARRLYRRTQVGQPIPPETFLEIARIYSKLDSKRREAVKLEVRP
jgi:flagellar biosynthesis protein FlhB